MEPYQSRRRALLRQLDRGCAIFFAAPTTIRNGSVEHSYRQDSDFYYLTGFDEPESVLVLSTVHPHHRSVLFLRPKDSEREVWDGPRVGVDDAVRRFGVDAALPIDDLESRLPDYMQNAERVVVSLGRERSTTDATVFRARDRIRARSKLGIGYPTNFVDPAANLHEMRLIKDVHEADLMRKAAEITAKAHVQVMRETRPGRFEYEIEAILTHAYRSAGAQRHAYEPIVASASNATYMHYVRNDRRIEDGDLVLVDSGCELGMYAADITRTFPANGKFSPAQRRIYEIVLAAQLAAIETAGPGVTVDQVHAKACEVLVDGLIECQLLTGTRERILEEKSYKRYFPHGTSHWLGMDVHDVGLRYIDGKPRVLEPGMVITVEPGLYVPLTGEHTSSEFSGIGVRIEDDVLITESAIEVLSCAVPKRIDEVEALCSS